MLHCNCLTNGTVVVLHAIKCIFFKMSLAICQSSRLAHSRHALRLQQNKCLLACQRQAFLHRPRTATICAAVPARMSGGTAALTSCSSPHHTYKLASHCCAHCSDDRDCPAKMVFLVDGVEPCCLQQDRQVLVPEAALAHVGDRRGCQVLIRSQGWEIAP